MKIIAHRANLYGPSPDENSINSIEKCLELGFAVEVDVWNINGTFLLGHDIPTYEVPISFFRNNQLWCHAKNLIALRALLDDGSIHCFWHQKDSVTLTSLGYIWTYPGEEILARSVAVMPESTNYTVADLSNSSYICTDYPFKYTNMLSTKL